MQAQLAVYIYRHGHEKHDLFFDRPRRVMERYESVAGRETLTRRTGAPALPGMMVEITD